MTRRLSVLVQSRQVRWLLLAALVTLYAGWVGYVVSRDKPVDFNLYYMAAYGFAHGHDVYGADTALWGQLAQETHIANYAPPYRYPPLAAMLVWPLTLLTPSVAAVLFLSVSALSSIGAAWLMGRSAMSRWSAALALGLLLAYVPVFTTLHAGQINCLVLLTLALSFYGLSNNRAGPSGTGVALGAMLKLIPLAHVGYLGWRRQWRALATSIVVLVAVAGLAIPLVQWSGLVSYLRHMLVLGEAGHLISSGANQSITGFLARVLAGWPADTVQGCAIGASLVLTAATALLCWPTRSATQLLQFEFALITVAVNLITPYTWYHQFALLLIPIFVLAQHLLKTPALRWLLLPLGSGYGLTDLHGLVWHSLEPWPWLVSMPFLTALLLWGLLAWLIAREKLRSANHLG